VEHDFYDFPIQLGRIGNVIIPIDELHHFFRWVGGSTTNQVYLWVGWVETNNQWANWYFTVHPPGVLSHQLHQ
jgi:hypothetical protein